MEIVTFTVFHIILFEITYVNFKYVILCTGIDDDNGYHNGIISLTLSAMITVLIMLSESSRSRIIAVEFQTLAR